MRKLSLNLEQLTVDSFDTTNTVASKGTIFGEQCTCYTNCTCPGCPTCDQTACGQHTCQASCNGTCAGQNSCDQCCNCPTAWNTCAYTCDCGSAFCGTNGWNTGCGDIQCY